MISLAKVFKFPVAFFNALGQNVVKAHVRHIRQLKRNPVSPSGKKYVEYTKAYERKKAAGKAAKKGESQISTSTTPDLTLTGKMLNAMRLIKATPNGFFYGITDPREAAKAEGHNLGVFGRKRVKGSGRVDLRRDSGVAPGGSNLVLNIPKGKRRARPLANERYPLPKPVQEMVVREMSKQIVRQISQEIRSKGMGVKVYEI
jgi:hypothetical protein